MPTKSRIKDLKIGDVFSFTESCHPEYKVFNMDIDTIHYRSGLTNYDTVARYSNQIILVLRNEPIRKPLLKCKDTGKLFYNFKDAARHANVSSEALRKYFSRNRKNKTSIIKL